MAHMEHARSRGERDRAPDRWTPAMPDPLGGRTDLLAVVAHELRQPIAAAMMATDFVAELLESGTPAGSVAQYIELARRSMRQSLRMTNDLVTLGQVGAGGLRLRPVPVDVAALLGEARALLDLAARAKRIDVRVVVGRALPQVVGDGDRLLQVLVNLCGNAIKFTPSGGRVTLGATADAASVRVTVRDTGPGVSTADLRRMFEPYWRADAASTGTGLGLAVSKWLVEAHGGRIAARAALGSGLTVAFTLPRYAAGAPRAHGSGDA